MAVVTIGTNNWEEEIAIMRAMLEKHIKEGEQKVVRIKLHEKKIY